MPIKRCTQARYEDMLGVLPPAMWLSYGFLVREAHSHRTCKVTGFVAPTFAYFFNHRGHYYEGDPLTFAEFRAFKPEDLP